jgi:threonine/homoserine/homoserine lactone efflux protein
VTFATLLGGVVFGLALAAPPGPMNAVIAEESVLRGWRAGFRAGLGAMVADLSFLGLALVGLVAVVRENPTVETVLFAAGGLLMLYFAVGAVQDAGSFVAEETGDGNGFWKAFLLALTNPYQIVFWLTVGIGLLEPGRLDVLAPLPVVGSTLADRLVVQTGHPVLLIGLFAGIALWITGFPAALVSARRRVDRLAPAVAWLSALVLAGFGARFLLEAAGRL